MNEFDNLRNEIVEWLEHQSPNKYDMRGDQVFSYQYNILLKLPRGWKVSAPETTAAYILAIEENHRLQQRLEYVLSDFDWRDYDWRDL